MKCLRKIFLNKKTAKKRVSKKNENIQSLGIVVGHNSGSKGAINYKGEQEWDFNKRIAMYMHNILKDHGYMSAILYRPINESYKSQCKSVVRDASDIGITKAMCLHFNAAGKGAMGCEVLVTDTANIEVKMVADNITDDLNEKLGIRERGKDGRKDLSRSHNGYWMLKYLEYDGVDAIIPEPCFANYRTDESEAIFETTENEKRYAAILAENAMKWMDNKLDPID